ncbi:MAG: Asp23/Gls24 family envelope stress response protein [Chloroflexota bacterium]|nr:Asp23/Gls24 family envelope stress response protein [Chloroflexota bacterium]
MTQRHRKENDNFDLQNSAISLTDLADGTTRGGSPAGTSGTSDGKVEVSPRAIAHLASRAAQSSYGMVGLASRHARPGIAELLRRDELYKGVAVSFADGQVVIDLYVVIEYGTRISEVARNIMSNVKFSVEQALGVPVVQVNVNVHGIRVSK